MPWHPFETLVDRYDAWFESPYGQQAFYLEQQCLARLRPTEGRWLEVGVGTGRFARALGISWGIDPAWKPLLLARARGVRVVQAYGERLPFPAARFDGVLLVVTLCFVEQPRAVLAEAARILRPRGHLLLGLIPAGTPLASYYQNLGRHGHPFYQYARFYTREQVEAMLADLDFQVVESCTLPLPSFQDIPEGLFLGLLAQKRDGRT